MRGSVPSGKSITKSGRVCRRGRIARASLTAECAGVLPVFFMAALTLIIFMNAVRLQTAKNLQLSNKARKLALAAGLTGETAEEIWIDLGKNETVKFPFPLFGLPALKVATRARVYPFIGSEEGIGGLCGSAEGNGSDLVYLTDNGEVYHTHGDCTHLDLTIIKTDKAGVKYLRNADGKKYKKCRGFPAHYDGPVYVTATGRYYYPSTEYNSLTRHVHVVKHAEAGGLKQCERCAARDRREKKHAA